LKVEGFIQESGRVLYGRLAPGSDLLLGIDALCEEFGVSCGSIVGCMGSLSSTTYTYVRPDPEHPVGIKYVDVMKLETPAELISAQGTIGVNQGNRDIHLHGVLSDADGNFIAGHLLPGCTVCATVELSILVAETGIERKFDEQTQFCIFRYGK